jgi:hypothetical protein
MMRIRKNNLWIFATLLIMALFLAACSPKDQLLGVWTEPGGELHIRIHTGNTISQRAYFGEDILSISGSYEILNDSQIRIEFTDGEWQGLKSGLYTYTIGGETLTLNDMTFERQPDVYNLE